MTPVKFLRGRRTPGAASTVALAAVLLGAASCGAPTDGVNVASAAQAASEPTPLKVIQHEVPRRDFVGPPPAEFRWSAIHGADRYAIGVWNESDRLLWRNDDLAEPHVPWPTGFDPGGGTYFWSVSALQNGREIATSGRAAFVIEE